MRTLLIFAALAALALPALVRADGHDDRSFGRPPLSGAERAAEAAREEAQPVEVCANGRDALAFVGTVCKGRFWSVDVKRYSGPMDVRIFLNGRRLWASVQAVFPRTGRRISDAPVRFGGCKLRIEYSDNTNIFTLVQTADGKYELRTRTTWGFRINKPWIAAIVLTQQGEPLALTPRPADTQLATEPEDSPEQAQ